MEEQEITPAPTYKGAPFSSRSRSKPYTQRRHSRITGNWNGVYNLLGLVYPALKTEPEIATRVTNQTCERFGL